MDLLISALSISQALEQTFGLLIQFGKPLQGCGRWLLGAILYDVSGINASSPHVFALTTA